MSRSLRAPWVLFLVLPAAVAAADVVRLRSGDVVEGRVDDLGDRLRVETAGGAVSLRWKDVEAVLPGRAASELFTEKRKAVGDKDAAGLYALALWAQRAGLPDEARRTFEAVVQADPEHAGARDALSQQKAGGAWQGGTKLLEAKGFVAQGGAWMLREEADLRARQAEAKRELTMDEKKVEDLLAKAGRGPDAARKFATDALQSLPVESLFRPALRALRGGEPGTRAVAATALARMKDEVDVRRPLIRSAVMDRDPEVRLASAAALRTIADPDVIKPIAKAMWSGVPEIRANAAEALGEIGGVSSVEWILTRVSTSGGPGARNHIFVGSQVTYVSDFDVEIAQAAQIGDPIVQTIREGAMLDVRVLNVREEYTILERRVAFTALRKATGRSFAEDPQVWKDWFEKEGRKEMTAAAK